MNLSITPFSHSKQYRDTLKMLYKRMIEFRKANPYDGAYGEIHHIVPKHLCKKLKIKQESAANKVRLSVKEHQYVHMLLERAHGLKIAHRTSIKDIADSKIATYKRFGFEKVGKIILTSEQKHVVNVSRKTKLRAYRKKINEFMSIHGSSQLIANAICDALRKKFEIPEEFQMNIGRKLTAHIRSDIPTFLNIGLIELGSSYVFENFKTCILEECPDNMSDEEIIQRENMYKDKFMTREFGYNNN